jgi:seryl-tRNA synthetase
LGEKTSIEEKIKAAEVDELPILAERDKLVNKVGNIVHDSVIESADEANNEVVKKWGEIPNLVISATNPVQGKAHHHEILYMIDGYDQMRGTFIKEKTDFQVLRSLVTEDIS